MMKKIYIKHYKGAVSVDPFKELISTEELHSKYTSDKYKFATIKTYPEDLIDWGIKE